MKNWLLSLNVSFFESVIKDVILKFVIFSNYSYSTVWSLKFNERSEVFDDYEYFCFALAEIKLYEFDDVAFQKHKVTIAANIGEQVNIDVNVDLSNKFSDFRHENARSFLLRTACHTRFAYRFWYKIDNVFHINNFFCID